PARRPSDLAGLQGGLFRGHQGRTNCKACRRDDVAALAVRIADQGDAGAAVRIVFDRLHNGGDVAAGATEVDDTVKALVATAAAAHRDLAVVVGPGLRAEGIRQGPVRPGCRNGVDRGRVLEN